MEYERKYQNRINWQNTPSMSTPLNATNLNKMDVALQYMDGKLAEASGDIVSIEANPSGTATSNLTKLKVDSTIYDVGSYTAGAGINIVNGVIQNTETGARSGIIDSISSSRAHTLITLATNETFKAYETLILKSETSGSASTLRVQYASSASSVYDYNLYDTDGTTAKTLSLESGKIIIVMLDQTGYKALVLSEDVSGGADALSDLTDTSISNPSTGQTIEYNSTSGKWENKLSTAVVANPSDTASTDLTKIKIGSTAYNIPSGGGLPENPLSTAHGGTGNADGFIRTGQKSGTTIGTNATAEGYDNTASGNFSHAEGRATTAGNYSHAEGYGTNAGAGANHAEGQDTTASGYNCHAEGANTTSSNTCTHAEGYQTTASGTYSHAGGRGTVAGYSTQTAIGKWNDNKSDTLLEVGNGASTNSKSNAFEVYSDGKISCDNGASKFQFTQSSGVDGYYDASGTFHAFGGSGNTISKTRYTINSSSWSSSQDVSGLYTYTLALNPTLVGSVNVYVAGSYDYIAPTDANKTNYSYVKRCNLNTSNLILRAYPKPDAKFYIWVEGVEGTNGSGTSYETAGNVIQPNGESSGGITLLGEIPITNMTYDSTDDSYGGSFFTTDSTFINAILNSPLLLVKMVGNTLNEGQQTNELYVLGSVLTGGNQGWMFGNILRDTFFAGCQSNTYVVGAQTYAVYPRIKAWFFSNKVATDTVKVQFYRVNL